MTREDLKRIISGIDESKLKEILDLNSRDIGHAKKDFKELLEENNTLKSEKEELFKKSTENEGYKEKFEELAERLRLKEEEEQDREMTLKIEECFGDMVEENQYIRRGLISDIKAEMKKPRNEGKSCQEVFCEFTFNKEGIFKNPNKPVEIHGLAEIRPEEITREEFKNMGYLGKNELYKRDKNLYERLTKE